jgi:tRNA (guanine-N7-)-methyltransferase
MVRQHVNPLLRRFEIYSGAPIASLFAAPTSPLHLDIGCAAGGLVRELARRRPLVNHLGVELRDEPLAQARRAAAAAALPNLAYVCVNLERSGGAILRDFPGPIETVSILHPDPCFKNVHAKRRVVTPALLDLLARLQPVGGRLFFQTDVRPLFDEVRERLRAASAFYELTDATPSIPLFGVPTEREALVRREGGEVFAAVAVRTAATAGARPS